jgi:capsular polysaccharide transport system permease protein
MDAVAPTSEAAAEAAPDPSHGLGSHVLDYVGPAIWHQPQDPSVAGSESRWRAFYRPLRPFLLVVILPTLLTAAGQYLIAADQYESEAHFIVRSDQGNSAASSSLGQMLGLGNNPTPAEARSLGDYLTSHDAVDALQKKFDLPAIFRRPEADIFTRLHTAKPVAETLLKYYRHQVDVSYNNETGITNLTVRAFQPKDAQALAESLLELGEARVNTFNQRALSDSLSVAKQQLAEAEAGVAEAQHSVTGFRQGERDIDPTRTSTADITMASTLQGQLAQGRAQLSAMGKAVDADSPQYVALKAQVQALETQVNAAQSRLAGPETAMAPGLGTYESLQLRQEFAAKRYEAAATALEGARASAMKQQIFVVRVVDPNLPQKALYPHRLKLVAIVFFGLLLSYAIGWLILAGVREHAS